jgi:hypothetical protein
MKRHRKARVVAILVVGMLGVGAWQFFRETHGIGVDSVWWLPSEARNITYIRNDLIAIAEFDIGQDAFERWCANQHMALRELRDGEEHDVGRCLSFLEQRELIPALSEPNRVEDYALRMERASKDLGAGDLFYEERWDNGGGYTIGYDTEEQRGYYSSNRH